MIHKIKGQESNETVLEWELDIDEDGELNLIANGVRILRITDVGTLCRYRHNKVEGLIFEERAIRIEY